MNKSNILLRLLENTKTVLVVDDEEEIRNIIIKCIRKHGMSGVDSNTTSQAIQVIRDQTPDLVITDLQGHNLDGRSVVIAAKKLGIPVIIMSGTIHNIPNNYGADVFIHKPFDLEGLCKTAKGLLK